jgi:hypothetical protein
MGEAAEHTFNHKWAAPPLKQAMQDLAEKTGRSLDELDGIKLGEAYLESVEAYGDELPEFWKVWNPGTTHPIPQPRWATSELGRPAMCL